MPVKPGLGNQHTDSLLAHHASIENTMKIIPNGRQAS
jgi:hypothetical protein